MKNIESLYPLSSMQEGMLYHTLYAPGSGVYVRQVSCRITGALNRPAFERAWQAISDRHPALRTFFLWKEVKNPVQVVARQLPTQLQLLDWRDVAPEQQAAQLRAHLAADRVRGFDLTHAPLMRLVMIRLAQDVYRFIWSFHHLLLDGWSVVLIINELAALYEAFAKGQELTLTPVRPYRDYIVWLQQQNAAAAEAFWRQELKGLKAATQLSDSAVSAARTAEQQLGEQQAQVSAAQTRALQALARQHKLTLNSIIQGAWALLLSHTTEQLDIVFGAAVAGRPAELVGVEAMVGLFINTLPLHVAVAPDKSLLVWLAELQSRQVEARRYEHTPLVQLQGWSEIPRGQAMFENVLTFHNYPNKVALKKEAKQSGVTMDNFHSATYIGLPLEVDVAPATELTLTMRYDRGRFADATITRLLDNFAALLSLMSAHGEATLAELLHMLGPSTQEQSTRAGSHPAAAPVLTAAERHRLLVEFNQTQRAYSSDKCVQQLFEAQVARTPDAVAVGFEGQQLSYAELNAAANQLAHYLRAHGVGPDVLVGLCVERSVELVIGLLGILKAGGAYVPLDPDYPQERLAFMLADAHIQLLLTQEHLRARLPAQAATIICLDTDWQRIAEESTEAPVSWATARNLAYVIYTSGSTGRPKGVLIEHRGLVNYLEWCTQAYAVAEGHGAPVHSSLGFDLTVTSLFAPLLTGRRVLLLSAEGDIEALVAALHNDANFSLVKITPAHLELLGELLDHKTAARRTNALVIGGETLLAERLAFWREHAPETRLINEYGPTETVVGCCVYEVTAASAHAGAVPIGRPVANTQLYVLDSALQPVATGSVGELYIGGVGLARGYLHRPELTAQSFIPHPFSAEAGARLYKTGDLARHLPDGNLELLGRIDQQMKVRGYRIELGEIEAVLNGHESVREAVVLARADAGHDKRLVAYVVGAQQTAPPLNELRRYLRERLPDYMIPAAFVRLASLPLTRNGKVDRKALPPPDETRLDWEQEFVAPRDALELELVQLWEETLNVRPIGIRDNFFALGGHSFLALRVIAQIEKRFAKDLPLAALIQGGTIEHLASMIRQETAQPLPWQALVPIKPTGTKIPFFGMHPIGGQVFCYVDLARHLGPAQPFYGLQAPRPEDAGDEQVSIEEMADYYLRAVQTIQPEGPYLLGGYSFGGFVAFEMAQRLQQQGQETALLALLDCRSPLQFNQLPAYEEDDAFMLTLRAKVVAQEQGRALDITEDEFRGLDYDAQLAHFIRRMHEAKLLPPEHDLNFMRSFMRGYKARQRAMRNYFPAIYPGCITLYRASKQNNWMLANFAQAGVDIHDPAYGWGTLSTQPVEVFDVPGNHDQMCYEPYVQVLAKRMRADIAGATLARPAAMFAGPAAQLSAPAVGQPMRDGMKKFLRKE